MTTNQKTMAFLLSTEAKPVRASRLDGYPTIGETRPTHVVHVETASNVFIELDADDVAHAKRLIMTWIKDLGNMTARYHFVKADGTLALSSRIYDFRDFQ